MGFKTNLVVYSKFTVWVDETQPQGLQKGESEVRHCAMMELSPLVGARQSSLTSTLPYYHKADWFNSILQDSAVQQY